MFSYYGHKSSSCTDVPGAWSEVIAGLIVYNLIKNGYDRFDQMTNYCYGIKSKKLEFQCTSLGAFLDSDVYSWLRVTGSMLLVSNESLYCTIKAGRNCMTGSSSSRAAFLNGDIAQSKLEHRATIGRRCFIHIL